MRGGSNDEIMSQNQVDMSVIGNYLVESDDNKEKEDLYNFNFADKAKLFNKWSLIVVFTNLL